MDDIITEQLIALDVELDSKDAVIRAVAGMFEDAGRISDSATYVRDVYAREELVETGIGGGIAIPHARSGAVQTASLAFIRLRSSVRWGDSGDVTLIFGIAVPTDNVEDAHLRILSTVARKLLDDEIRRVIEESDSRRSILDALAP